MRVPKLYAVYVGPDLKPGGKFNTYYLIMEYIPGERLDWDVYFNLDSESRKTLGARIAEQLQELQSIPQEPDHGTYYGHLNHKGWTPFMRFLETHNKDLCGPYDTHADLASDIYACFERHVASGIMLEDFQECERNVRSHIELILSNNKKLKPTLTHLDLKIEHVIARQIDDAKGEGGKDWEVTLIDWECCGWMPAWMQAPSCSLSIGSCKGWSEERANIFLQQVFGSLDQYQPELKMVEELSYNHGFGICL